MKKLGKFNRIGHRVTHDPRRRARPTGSAGICASGVQRPFPARLFGNPSGRKARLLLAVPVRRLRFFRSLGVKVERIMTDNGSSSRSRRYAKALRRLKIKHLRTKPYTPKTNGKAERFVQTSLREWAYARAYDTSQQRAAELPLAPSLQLASPPWQYRLQAANQQNPPNRGQPLEAPQLGLSKAGSIQSGQPSNSANAAGRP